jgi:DNA uptake protein ComE-like DNA-binding protein
MEPGQSGDADGSVPHDRTELKEDSQQFFTADSLTDPRLDSGSGAVADLEPDPRYLEVWRVRSMKQSTIVSLSDTSFSRRRLLAGSAALGAIGALGLVPRVGAQSPAATPAPFTLVNLNSGTDDEILAIPGVNDRMLDEFKEYRPYGSILQFRKEIGKYVGDEQVKTWEAYVFVPIDVNQADAETLQQLPGVDATIAKKLIDGRTYKTNQAFLDLLKTLVSATDFENAHDYLAEMK